MCGKYVDIWRVCWKINVTGDINACVNICGEIGDEDLGQTVVEMNVNGKVKVNKCE